MAKAQTSIELPIFDISQPLDPSSLSSLSQACKELGFFHIRNHGVTKDLYKRLYSLSKHIFSLPLESKLKVGPFSSVNTYTPHFIASPFFESLRVSGPDFFASAQASATVLLNQQSSEFSEILREYGSKMTELSKRIVQVVLMSLGENFEQKFYGSEFRKCHGYLRIINYTPPESVKEEDEVEGLGKHTDMSCITIVYQDQVGGVQVRSKQGKWLDINPSEETLLINIGDLMQAWSNEKLRSSEHRVVLKRFVNRFSLAFFWCFEDQKVIYAPNEVVGEGHLRVYKPFLCEDYLKFREISSVGEGKFEKVGFTVKDFAGITGQKSTL
ncbi:Oxoglutarate/iron-dependent dioxygenase [Trema orientale]|uniref:Oxoglutarate/iron-dependent dioxygenase n=1 Tax=Trema orientale TaxID=63057 RepID=A0A2P5AGC1_TREOI|nr:Oxoglutarate/iron-dependent dioxygenase [Trema orientale]